MSTKPAIAVLATLDTKGPEAEFLARAIEGRGRKALLIDIGLLGTPGVRPDISRTDVVGAGASGLSEIPADRQSAMDAVADGAGATLELLLSRGELAGAIAVGGSKGTWIASSALRRLPWGVPKMVVASTVPPDMRRYVGSSDLVYVSAVVDIAGLNSMTELLLTRAAAMISAAADAKRPQAASGPVIAVSMAGVVTECGLRVERGLRAHGFEPVILPANGIGGSALEGMVRAGLIHGVVELALMELSNEILGGFCVAGPDRLEGATELGLPQVIVPGGVDFANFAGRAAVPTETGRVLLDHTPEVTLMRLTAQESRRTGELVGSKLAPGGTRTRVVIPLRGFSSYDQAGGPFADPDADQAFIEGLRAAMRDDIAIVELDQHINDPSFADAVVEAFVRLNESTSHRAVRGAPDATSAER